MAIKLELELGKRLTYESLSLERLGDKTKGMKLNETRGISVNRSIADKKSLLLGDTQYDLLRSVAEPTITQSTSSRRAVDER
jgi:hypothetical protein